MCMLSTMETLIFFLISLAASTVGAIAGIGGGVIIKPVLDSFHVLSVATISFLSGCTVLSMSCYSVLRTLGAGDSRMKLPVALPLGIGAAVGGVTGKELFKHLSALGSNPDAVGAVQAACLVLVTLLTLLYTLFSGKIRKKDVRQPFLVAVIGLVMGLISAFLGIGGGPINLMVLGYFFSMDVKAAAQNSLLVILLSQIASLITTFVTGTVPDFPVLLLCLMIVGGILGGIFGRRLNRRLDARQVNLLFCAAMVVIILISVRNFFLFI